MSDPVRDKLIEATAQELVRRVLNHVGSYGTCLGGDDVAIASVASALREVGAFPAKDTWPPNNPDPGKVGLRVEVWPHDPGANGEDYHSGHIPAGEAARVLRDIADRCENEWTNPECPWPDEHGVDVPTPSEQQLHAEAAKPAAYEASRP